MTFDLQNLVRDNIRRLKPYSSARSEFAGAAEVFLDANENAFGSPAGDSYNRYPDPLQSELKRRVGEMTGVLTTRIFIGNGSDEALDLLFRIFCDPGNDEVIICPPTYGMYRVSADINDVGVREVRLTREFQLDAPAILNAIDERTKLIFICSPNNPTGNLMQRDSIIRIARQFEGIVVVDEAYVHFSGSPSMIEELDDLPNLVVLQTFSKAWGMAGLRVGLTFANEPIVELMNRVKPPYNVSAIAQDAVVEALSEKAAIDEWIAATLEERERVANALRSFSFVENVYPSDVNFLLVRVKDADMIYKFLIDRKIVVRDRSRVELCNGCLRITIGTASENDRLLSALRKIKTVDVGAAN